MMVMMDDEVRKVNDGERLGLIHFSISGRRQRARTRTKTLPPTPLSRHHFSSFDPQAQAPAMVRGHAKAQAQAAAQKKAAGGKGSGKSQLGEARAAGLRTFMCKKCLIGIPVSQSMGGVVMLSNRL